MDETIRAERLEKLKRVAEKRQPNITIVLENVSDMHNVSAVLRTCDAIGIPEIYVVMDENLVLKNKLQVGKRSSSGARKWVDVHAFASIEDCLTVVKAKYDLLIGTVFDESARPLYDQDFTGSFALIMGNEKRGLSKIAQNELDARIFIPQIGMTQSLNISVACAISMYEIYRQRAQKGLYESGHFVEGRAAIFQEYIKRHRVREYHRQAIKHDSN